MLKSCLLTMSSFVLIGFTVSCSSLMASNNLEDESDRFIFKSTQKYGNFNSSQKKDELNYSKINLSSNQKKGALNELDYTSLKKILQDHLTDNKYLLNSSKGKDIVVFLGNTGSGKSTLINYLSGKELQVEDEDIILKNPKDLSAMMIGIGEKSETHLPKFIEYDDLLFYDLPGLRDTQGLSADLLNTYSIEEIIKNANTVRIVFVAGEGEIEEGRGKSLKEIIKIADDLIPDTRMKDLSALVITKSTFNNIGTLGTHIRKKCGEHPILNEWISEKRLVQMARPKGVVKEDDKKEILFTIRNTKPAKIQNLNSEALLKDISPYKIRELYIQTSKIHKSKAVDDPSIEIALESLDGDEWTNTLMKVEMMRRVHTRLFKNDPVIKFVKRGSEIEYERAKDILESFYKVKSREVELKSINDANIKMQKQLENILESFYKGKSREVEIIEGMNNANIKMQEQDDVNIKMQKQLEELKEKQDHDRQAIVEWNPQRNLRNPQRSTECAIL